MMAVRQERHAVNAAGVARATLQLLSRVEVPEPHGPVVAAGDSVPAVGREGDARNGPGVAHEATQLLTGLDLPQPHRAIDGDRRLPLQRIAAAAGEEATTVGGDRQAMDARAVSLELAQQTPFRNVPEPQRRVETTGDDLPAVGDKGDPGNHIGMPFQERRWRPEHGGERGG